MPSCSQCHYLSTSHSGVLSAHWTSALFIYDFIMQYLPCYHPSMQKIKLSNSLIQKGGSSSTMLNGFHNPSTTNLHTHGLHDDAGNLDQNGKATYTGGDNIFVTIPPRSSRSDSPQSLTYDRVLPEDHTPGLYWYHPHAHGSTAIQVRNN